MEMEEKCANLLNKLKLIGPDTKANLIVRVCVCVFPLLFLLDHSIAY